MKTKKVPMRMCVVTRELKPKSELVRIVKTTAGEIKLDYSGKIAGRGAYITNSLDVLNKCIKTKVLQKVFEQNINSETYAKLLEEFRATDQQQN